MIHRLRHAGRRRNLRRLLMLAALVIALAGCSSAPPPATAVPPPAPARMFRLPDSGIYGNLYLPAGATGRARAVLLLGGSQGGMSSVDEAEALTEQGSPS